MRFYSSVLGLLLMVMLTGCTNFMGTYYLNHGEYSKGIQSLSDDLSKDPDDAEASYFIGRFYLGLEQSDKAVTYLKKAAELEPENADYQFWVGVAHWALEDFAEEKSSYEKALSLDEKNISANLYLAHSFLDAGDLAKALPLYDKVIELDKYNPQALYNRADILTRTGNKLKAVKGWQKFLEYYPDGILAVSATEKLNELGDFTYRNFILGKRNVTLKSIKFKSGSSKSDLESNLSLRVVAAIMESEKNAEFHIVAYTDGNKDLAKYRARKVRDYILGGHPGVNPARLPLSWFGTSEVVKRDGKEFQLAESIRFITVVR